MSDWEELYEIQSKEAEAEEDFLLYTFMRVCEERTPSTGVSHTKTIYYTLESVARPDPRRRGKFFHYWFISEGIPHLREYEKRVGDLPKKFTIGGGRLVGKGKGAIDQATRRRYPPIDPWQWSRENNAEPYQK